MLKPRFYRLLESDSQIDQGNDLEKKEVKTDEVVETEVKETEPTTTETTETTTEVVEEPKEDEEVAPKDGDGEKTYTKEQINEIVEKRLAKERGRMFKKLGIENEDGIESLIAKIGEYKVLKAEHDAIIKATKEAELTKRLAEHKIDKDFNDYVIQKLGEDADDAAIEELIKSNPKILVREEQPQIGSNFPLDGSNTQQQAKQDDDAPRKRWNVHRN